MKRGSRYRAELKNRPQVARFFQASLSRGSTQCQVQNSPNLGTTFLPTPVGEDGRIDGGQLLKVEFRRVVGYRAKKRGGNKMGPFICYVCADFGMGLPGKGGCVDSFAQQIISTRLRGLPLSTSALRGGGGYAQKRT